MVDNLIRLFESDALSFDSNGIGSILDATSCIITEERNGVYELEMDYPITGSKYSELTHRRLIVAKPNQYADPQPFRIYSISKPINGIITVNAAHISYDLSGYTVAPMSANTAAQAFVNMVASADVNCPFTFWTNKTTAATMSTNIPYSMRAILGGMEGSILDTYRGEYEFDGLTVKLWDARGTNRGVVIRYGKNLTDLKQEENCNNVYTAVRPFWYKEGDVGGYVELPEKTIAVTGTFNYTKIYALDLSDRFEDKPTAAQLRSAARSYISENNLGIPDVSLDVSFVQLSDSEEYKNISLMERVQLCDTVTIEFPKLGVSAVAECIKTEYDVLTQKYTSIELGSARSNLSKTISGHNQSISESATRSYVERTAADASENATAMITGNMGGYVILHDSNGDGKPDEILIMNTDDITTATKVWRWNKNGLGYSSTGYNGNYGTAINANGQIVADYVSTGNLNASLITTGTLNANRIKAGTISDVQGHTSINMTNGIAKMWELEAVSGFKIRTESDDATMAEFARNIRNTHLYLSNSDTSADQPIRIVAQSESATGESASIGVSSTHDNGGVELIAQSRWEGLYPDNYNGGCVRVIQSNNKTGVIGACYTYGGGIYVYNIDGKSVFDMWVGSAKDGTLNCKNSSGNWTINCSGNTGVIKAADFTRTSSIKVKNNIRPMDMNEIFKVLDLNPVSFDYKDERQGNDKRGFIAEEVQKILPNLVMPETDDGPMTLDYISIIPYLVGVVKDQEKRIQSLEEKINKLLGGVADGTD